MNAPKLIFLILLTLFPISASAQSTYTGWRGDGTGRFENVKPPTSWDSEGAKIVWKVKVDRGFSSPVFHQGRIFLTSDPSNVVCFDSKSGKEVWRKSLGYEDVLGAAKAKKINAKHTEFADKKQAINKEYKELRKSELDSPRVDKLKQQLRDIDKQLR